MAGMFDELRSRALGLQGGGEEDAVCYEIYSDRNSALPLYLLCVQQPISEH